MPNGIPLPFMYLTYLVVGAVFLAAVCAALVRLCLASLARRRSASALRGQEFVWTLVPVLVMVGLTVLGEIPQGWAKAAAPRAAERQGRAIR